jgi:hypothetical protein
VPRLVQRAHWDARRLGRLGPQVGAPLDAAACRPRRGTRARCGAERRPWE